MRLCPACGARYEAPAQYCQRDGVPLRIEQEASDPYLGTKILGQFRLEQVVGSGGMGVVYAGWDEGIGRRVAVKILHRDLVSNRDMVQRFHREAQIAHQLDHPNIVRLILFGQLPDGNLYLVLEYLEGPTLAAVLEREGALAPARAVKVVSAIADAIGYAHRRDIVHRDLKPENVILVHRDGDPDHAKVLDFGIAKMLMSGDTVVTQAGLIFGTARYISPEGAQGDPVDKRSDVYSLGVIAYQLLSGQTPFDAPEPVQLLLKHIHEAAPPLRRHPSAQHVSPALEAAVMRALAKAPAARYADGSALAKALREALAESDPSSAIRSVVPTAATPMFTSPPAITPAPEGDSGVRANPVTARPAAPHATLVNGSFGAPLPAPLPAPMAPMGAEPVAPRPASMAVPAAANSSGPWPAAAVPARARKLTPAAERVQMPAIVPYAPPSAPQTYAAPSAPQAYAPPEVPTGRFRPAAAPAAPLAPLPSALETDEDFEVPGLPARRRPGQGKRTVVTVVATVVLTVLVGAGATWALGLYPSQRREAELQGLLARADEALQAERLVRDPAGNDVERLTSAVLSLSPGHARARQLRLAAAMHLRNEGVQQLNEGHPERAVPALRGALRLAEDPTELRELLARAERERAAAPTPPTPSPTPTAAPAPAAAARPPAPAPAPRPRPTAPAAPPPPPPAASPMPAIPTGRPTFTPGRDPSMPPPPPPPPSWAPPVVIAPSEPPPRPPPPPPPPPPNDPGAGGMAF
jgi:serine/threonine-protein kinase